MCASLWPLDCSTLGFPVHHQLPEHAQTHVHRNSDAVQTSHPGSSPSPPAFNFSQHQVFQMSQFFMSGGQSIWVSASASVLPMNIQDWFPLGLTGLISLQSKGLSRVFSDTTVQKHQFFGDQLSYSPTFTSIHDYWKNHSFGYRGCEVKWNLVMSDSLWPCGLYSPWNSLGQNTGVDSLSLLQEIFLMQESTRVSYVAGGFFTNELSAKPYRECGERAN